MISPSGMRAGKKAIPNIEDRAGFAAAGSDDEYQISRVHRPVLAHPHEQSRRTLLQPRPPRSNSGNSPIRLTPWEPYFINSLTYGPLIQMEDNYNQNGLDTEDKEDWKVVYDHIYEKARRIHESSATQAEKATKIADLCEDERLCAYSPAVLFRVEQALAEWVEQIKATHIAG